ncbi:uncharacterized protein LOC111024968 [Momordica charantia]|uniref:Uncharacterized protein LOC111024968 n=1 Tax=Momordica charantia TaxID=3673 RepID=A0A6J1DZK3_MOMCH|nr:uncharacterized protein LOC111024968 [Momordica charantia]
MQNLSTSELRLTGITCWALWNDRDALINKKKIPEALIKVEWILKYAEEVRMKYHNGMKRRIPRVNEWRPPLGGVVKMNTDAAVSEEGSGVGVLLREGNAEIVGAMVDFHMVKTPLLAKILAIREGLSLATRLGVHRVVVETDSLEALNLIGDKSPWKGEAVSWVEDIRAFARDFQEICFQHVFRESNAVAYHLGRETISLRCGFLWRLDFPIWLGRLAEAGKQNSVALMAF